MHFWNTSKKKGKSEKLKEEFSMRVQISMKTITWQTDIRRKSAVVVAARGCRIGTQGEF